jgi:hypothetical protein
MIPQGSNPICWVACVAMITSWKTNATHSISEFTGGFDPSNSCIANPCQPSPSGGWDSMYSLLNGWGFTPDGANMSISSDYIASTLSAHGPFIMSIFAANFPFFGPFCLNMKGNPNETHAVVVNGVDTDAGTVQITNPWGTVTPPADINVITGLMQAISNQGLHPVAFMP